MSSFRRATRRESSCRIAPAAALRGLQNGVRPALLARVGSFKNVSRNKDFTTHFEIRIDALFLRSSNAAERTANRARVLRDVFADAPIATRDTAHQQTIFVLKRQ